MVFLFGRLSGVCCSGRRTLKTQHSLILQQGMIRRSRWLPKARHRQRTKGANGSEQIRSVSQSIFVAVCASKHKIYNHASDISFSFYRHRVRDLNFQDGSKKGENLFLVQFCFVHAALHMILSDDLQHQGKQYGFLCFLCHVTD